jgi:hypothetical protein
MQRHTANPRSTVIWVLLLLGFGAMEFPGVLFFANKSEPEIFGLPFIYGYVLLLWAYMCVVLLYAYRVHWGHADYLEGDEQ